MVALTAAHGYAQVSGKAQAVLVHVECGTQALAGAVHNAAKGRVPVLVFAGASPVHAGRRAARQPQRVHPVDTGRAGPARHRPRLHEIRQRDPHRRERQADRPPRDAVRPQRPEGPGLPDGRARGDGGGDRRASRSTSPTGADRARRAAAETRVAAIVDALAPRERPLVVTSYVGRNPAAVAELVRLCERLGIGVLESVPSAMNFPHDDPLYLGNQWNEPSRTRRSPRPT